MNYLDNIKNLHECNISLYKKQKECNQKIADYAQKYMTLCFNKLPKQTKWGNISSTCFYVTPCVNDNVDFCTIDFDKLEICYYKKPLERLIHQEISRCDIAINNLENKISEEQYTFISKRNYCINGLKHFHFVFISNQNFKFEQEKSKKRISNYKNEIKRILEKREALQFGMDNYIYYLDWLYQKIKEAFGNEFTYVKEDLTFNDIRQNATLKDIIAYRNMCEV